MPKATQVRKALPQYPCLGMVRARRLVNRLRRKGTMLAVRKAPRLPFTILPFITMPRTTKTMTTMLQYPCFGVKRAKRLINRLQHRGDVFGARKAQGFPRIVMPNAMDTDKVTKIVEDV